jgi:hypothetical protein
MLSGLDGANQGMSCGRKMFGGVFVLRGIAAAYFATDETESEMYPGVTCLDALLAFVFVGVLEFDLVCVSAVWAESFHGRSPFG